MSAVVILGAITSGKSLLLTRCRSRFTQPFQLEEWLPDPGSMFFARRTPCYNEEAAKFLWQCSVSSAPLLLTATPDLIYYEPQWSEFLAARKPLLLYLDLSVPELIAGLKSRRESVYAAGEQQQSYRSPEVFQTYLECHEQRLKYLDYPVKYVKAVELKVAANLQAEILQLLEYRLFNTTVRQEFSGRINKLQISCAAQFKNRYKRSAPLREIIALPTVLDSLAWQGPAEW